MPATNISAPFPQNFIAIVVATIFYHFSMTNAVMISSMTLNSVALSAVLIVFIKDKVGKIQANNFTCIGQVMQKRSK